MNLPRIALASLLAASNVGAFAFQGEAYPVTPPPFQSTQTRAEVQAQANTPLRISNGGTGVQRRPTMADRGSVKSGAVAIAPKGATAYGDF